MNRAYSGFVYITIISFSFYAAIIPFDRLLKDTIVFHVIVSSVYILLFLFIS